MAYHGHICGFYYIADEPNSNPYRAQVRKYLPQVDLSVHSTILASTSRTTLSQNFINPVSDKAIPELRYTFPLYDGVSVVGFTCTINKDRVIRGVVRERNEARKTYDQAVARGEAAGLLEQLPNASDVFTTTVGNVPSGAQIKVDITYLGELKHDAEGDGSIRFTIPTSIAPRYGEYPGDLVKGTNVSATQGIKIIVDAEMPAGSNISSVQSPSHPIAVTIGNTSAGALSAQAFSPHRASATLSLATAELGKDFVLQVVATDMGSPVAVLETHPTLVNHRAIMATLVPKFNLPSSRPEIVFVCDRSGSMGSGQRIPHLKAALQIFLKSLPLGVKFNICSFGSHHRLLFDKGSVAYDASSVEKAVKYVDGFAADHGGTEMYRPLEDVIQKRHKDMDLEVFLLTDGEVWNQENLIDLVNKSVQESKGAIRIFTLGIGDDVSHALIEGLARAGNGFSQTVMDNEKMNAKVLRMLKASLTPHITDYNLELKYQPDTDSDDTDTDFEIVEKVIDTLTIDTQDPPTEDKGSPHDPNKKTISLFDPTADPDADLEDASKDKTAGGRYAGVPPVSEPKLLQAPFTIPPLYPFSRTSVYLLLSPDCTQKNPKSLILRGSSACGPLELEIPITILPERTETIHQLAARKAIRELEDGRGWIFHAKDSGDGKLLKDKFPGRFSDMVEREAVRLGVKFQVGGKWCSFVAVEDHPSQAPGSEPRQEPTSYATAEDLLGHAPRLKKSKARHMFGGASAAIPSTGLLSLGSGVLHSRQMSAGFAARASTASSRGGGPSNTASPSQPSEHLPRPAPMMAVPIMASYKMGRARAADAVGEVTERKGLASRRPPGVGKTLYRRAGFARADESDEEWEGDEPSNDKMGFAMCDEMEAMPTPKAQPKDPFDAVVALQRFEGYWAWTDELFRALKVEGDMICLQAQMSSNQIILALGAELSTKSDKLATAIVLAWLETKMRDRKDEWEMMANKAYQWLEAAMPNGVTASYMSMVKDMVAGLG
ncbi:von Willebrand factor A domain-containing protein 5A [Coniochaeta hoffmannii]|uniref:von Willebrand factor A domain-containing protein 5A n=1 Tax=Coniochaeta hoffmannii TaxID=91930 RepID=A0AA38RK40_9PEZI|nr:von Willebrand factor A domain-containing protein 5A [Coniochaeta hoffmannii]